MENAQMQLLTALSLYFLGASGEMLPGLSDPVLYMNVDTKTILDLNLKTSAPQWSLGAWTGLLADELNIADNRAKVWRIAGGATESSFQVASRIVKEYASPAVRQVKMGVPLHGDFYIGNIEGISKAGLRTIAQLAVKDVAAMYGVERETVHALCTSETTGIQVRYSVDLKHNNDPQEVLTTYISHMTPKGYLTTSTRQGLLEAIGGDTTATLLKSETTTSTLTLQGIILIFLTPAEIELLSREAAKSIAKVIDVSQASVNTLMRSGVSVSHVDFTVSSGSGKTKAELDSMLASKLNDTDISNIQTLWEQMTTLVFKGAGASNSSAVLCRGVGCETVGSPPLVQGGVGWYIFPAMDIEEEPNSRNALENSLLLDISNQYGVSATSISVQLQRSQPGKAVFSVISTVPQVQTRADNLFSTAAGLSFPLLEQAYASVQTNGSVEVDKNASRQPELLDRSYLLLEPVNKATFDVQAFQSSVIEEMGLGDCNMSPVVTVSSYGDTQYLKATVQGCERTHTNASLISVQFTEGTPSPVDLRSAVLSSSLCCKDTCLMAVFCTKLGIVNVDLSHLSCPAMNASLHCQAKKECIWKEGSCATQVLPTQSTTAAPLTPTPDSSNDFPWFLVTIAGGSALLCLILLAVVLTCIKKRRGGLSITKAREEPKEFQEFASPSDMANPHRLPENVTPHLHPIALPTVVSPSSAQGPETLYPSPPHKVPFRLPPPPVATSQGVGSGSGSQGQAWYPATEVLSPPPLLKALPFDPNETPVPKYKDVLPALSDVNPLKGMNPLAMHDMTAARTTTLRALDRHNHEGAPQLALKIDELDLSV